MTSTNLTSDPASAPEPAADTAHRYNGPLANAIEAKWQQRWAAAGTFNAPNPVGPLATGEPVPERKLFVQDMFPYPSGAGLHVGHPLGFIATDVYARYHRMLGYNVLHTMGFDAFGLPAEQYALQTGTHPRITTETNIANYLQQIRALGLGHEERRRFSTTDPEYYHWTQWIFLQIYHSWYDTDSGQARPIEELTAEFARGARTLDDGRVWDALTPAEQQAVLSDYRLVYLAESTVNWCPGLGTVLSNEEVTPDGRSERGDFPVFRKRLRQWMMRITAYADRLVDDLDTLQWPEKVKTMQRNWIGRSLGAQVLFPTGPDDAAAATRPIEVFTTRPDTLFGATYTVLAPELGIADELVAAAFPPDTDPRWTLGAATPREALAEYRRQIASKSDLQRQEAKDKTGVFLGSYATNPVNGAQVPIFVSDYVLAGYGTGMVMAVPAHDARDHEFATAFGLPIVPVLTGGDATAAYVEGTLQNSSHGDLSLDGLSIADAKTTVVDWLQQQGHGRGRVEYKLRDWLFARQRYWGEPFPIVYDAAGNPHALPESQLPVLLPEIDDYRPVSFDPDDADSEPSPPLEKATAWKTVELDLGDGLQTYTRDTNVMPNWAGSSWYELRYVDPTNTEALADKENEAYWLGPRPAEFGAADPGGVDLYVGGVEHAVLHLLYARFWHKVLFDRGFVTSSEPFRRLFNQGMLQGYVYRDDRGFPVPAAEVVESNGTFSYDGQPVTQELGKIGKSLKNAVAPETIIGEYGADTFRVYEMNMGPLDQSRPWVTKDAIGAQRFLQRVWRLVVDEESGAIRVTDTVPDEETLRALHAAIAASGPDYAALRFNTAASALIKLTNHLTKNFPAGAPRTAVEPLVQLLAPLAPHIAEELWNRLGHSEILVHHPFPVAEEKYLIEDTIEIGVQVNGKARSRISVPVDGSREQLEAIALADPKIADLVGGNAPRKVIVVPGKIVNVIV